MTSTGFPSQPLDDVSWWFALTLDERLAANNLVQSKSREDRESKLHRTTPWRRKHRNDITRVKEPATIPIDLPHWLQEFRAGYAEAGRRKTLGNPPDGFLACVEPLLARSRQRINAALQRSSSNVWPTSEKKRLALVSSFELNLRNRLSDAISKTLALELAVASRRNLLAGKSPRERFAFFCDCLAEPDFARALLEQYPVLVRRIATITHNWETSSLALLSRLSMSIHTIHKHFFDGVDQGPLVAVETSGDTHCNGQAVHVLTFATGQRLVYKPRSVAMESCFFDLVAWLNRGGCEPRLKEVRTLDEGHFGWMEFIEEKPCQTKDEVKRFFLLQGAQIALTYILGGADLHFENVIAHGDYPVLVDLETLFQTRPITTDLAAATALGWRALRTSIMGTLLLPEPMFLEEDGNWVDFSALGHREGQLTPFDVPLWRADGTDRMRLLHERIPMAGGKSLPAYDNLRTQASPYVDLVVKGLSQMYRFLQKHKVELLSERGPLMPCLGKPVRHVFRGTAWYARLLDASHHPRYLTDAIASEAFLHNRLMPDSENSPWLVAIENLEVASLLSGDIPYYLSRVGERSILTESTTIDFQLPGNGWEECRARIEAMSNANLDRQTWLARVAMADVSMPADRKRRHRARPSSNLTSDALISAATRIGERICDIAITDGDRATWLIPAIVDKHRLVASVAGYDLYNGLPGIALFLGHLGNITGKTRFNHFTIAAMSEALALNKGPLPDVLHPGAFDGIGGLAYALTQLTGIVDRPTWRRDAIEIFHKAIQRVARSSDIDVISGQAGLIVAALNVHCETNDTALIGKLRPLAQKLRQLAAALLRGSSLLPPTKADAGVAHGWAGIGFALLRWAEVTGDSGFRDTGAELIRFDVQAIDASRSETEPKVKSGHSSSHLGWCSGLPGAALVALQTKSRPMILQPDQSVSHQSIADEIIGLGVEGPLCLCHGALGHMEFLRTAEEHGVLKNAKAAAAWRNRLLGRLVAGDWVADFGHVIESPGLMLGLAGTGYSLLRAVKPQLLPSILTLEPSRTRLLRDF